MAGAHTKHARFADIPPRTLRKMARFLRAYARTGIILTACQAAGIARCTFYQWQGRYPVFAAAAGEAQEAAADRLEQEMIRRAVKGDRQPVYQGGRLVGFRTQRSDSLLMFALKGMRPGKYKEKLLDASDLASLFERFRHHAGRLTGEVIDAEPVAGNGEAAAAVLEPPHPRV